MLKKVRFYFAGILTGVLVSVGAVSYAQSGGKTIDVIFDKIKLEVNGNKLNKETLLYNGITYVPIRSVAEALGADVEYDNEKNTAKITTFKEKDNKAEEKKDLSTGIKGDIEKLPISFDVSDKKNGYRVLTATVGNYTGYTLVDYSVTLTNKATNSSVALKSSRKIENGERLEGLSAVVSNFTKEADLEISNCVFTLSNENESVQFRYNGKSRSYY
ncbi:MAG TPA: hypothetical protein DCG28_05470 [Lachnospiraceae bacterium]|nr:hypothetical protein [Lachnospiraceae bacterium]